MVTWSSIQRGFYTEKDFQYGMDVPCGAKLVHLSPLVFSTLHCRWKEKYKRTASSKFVEGRKPTLSDGQWRCQDATVKSSTIQCGFLYILARCGCNLFCESSLSHENTWKQKGTHICHISNTKQWGGEARGLLKNATLCSSRLRKEWKQICLPWSDTWEESAAGIIRKERHLYSDSVV